MFWVRNEENRFPIPALIWRPACFKDYCDTESEDLSSLIHLSVSDGQKTESSTDASFIGIISNIL